MRIVEEFVTLNWIHKATIKSEGSWNSQAGSTTVKSEGSWNLQAGSTTVKSEGVTLDWIHKASLLIEYPKPLLIIRPPNNIIGM